MRPRNEISVPPGRDANSCIRQRNAKTGVGALRYAAKQPQFPDRFFKHILYCFFVMSPYARVCAGFAGSPRSFMERFNFENFPQIIM